MARYYAKTLIPIGIIGIITGCALRFAIATGGWIAIMITMLGCLFLGFMLPNVADLWQGQRAYKLLLTHLDAQQRYDLQRHGRFEVRGSDGVVYRLRQRFAYNVCTPGGAYCAHPRDVPIFDVMLAQKLLLETNAPAFMRCASLARSDDYW